MAIGAFAFALVATLLIAVVGAKSHGKSPNKVVYCNIQKIPSGSPFYNSLECLYEFLVQNTGVIPFEFPFKTSCDADNGGTAYGESQCSQQISQSDCINCLYNAWSAMLSTCNDAIGAQIQYGDQCYIRYEQYSF